MERKTNWESKEKRRRMMQREMEERLKEEEPESEGCWRTVLSHDTGDGNQS